ncbi:hypothetical protein [Actinoplanes sp. CA-252034]|uniref:hypothetical protein n=1 Tax=Actinoplanes sp. CA-252034 TaxID=3239906 RepID=UPI003D96D2EA
MADVVAPARTEVSRGWVGTLVGVQLYVLTSYLATAIVPYLWAPREYPPTWLWIVPGWLLGVPGYFITVLGAALAVPLAVAGLIVAVTVRRRVSDRLFAWCAGTAVAMTLYAIFTFTALGRDLILFVAD